MSSGHLRTVFVNLPYIPNVHWEYRKKKKKTHLFVSQWLEKQKTLSSVIVFGQSVLSYAVLHLQTWLQPYLLQKVQLLVFLSFVHGTDTTTHMQCESSEDNCAQRQAFQ